VRFLYLSVRFCKLFNELKGVIKLIICHSEGAKRLRNLKRQDVTPKLIPILILIQTTIEKRPLSF